jgi:predicted phosphodiesterase
MQYAILADVHGNLEALEAVLEDIKARGGVDETWCLGDIVGYGPDPHLCLKLARRSKFVCVAGNHDWGAVGKVDISDFNPEAAEACRWTGRQLSEEERDFIASLPLSLEKGDFTLVHGSPRQPIWEYLLSPGIARVNMKHFTTPYCLIGHSHIPLYFELYEDESCYLKNLPEGAPLRLGKNRLIVNPGGVGQPRDSDPRASYLIYDEGKAEIYHYRVEYDIAVTQRKMLKKGLPPRLAARLSYGI